MTRDALVDTQRAFDWVAPQYHATNAANPLLSAFRARTLAALRRHAPAPAHLLDLGCGPGSDAETLACEGYHVTGVDWSAAMVGEARHRMDRAGLDDAVKIRHLGIHELEQLDRDQYDAVLSNMGPLNCVPDLRATATATAGRLRPGGVLVATSSAVSCRGKSCCTRPAGIGDVSEFGSPASRSRYRCRVTVSGRSTTHRASS